MIPSCAAPRINTTTLTAADIVRMTDEMAADLAASPAIAQRNAASEPWVFTLDQVANRTEHLMDESERWGTMIRFRSRLSESFLARERHIRFVVPAVEWRRYADAEFRANPDARLVPTHALRAEFRSDTSTSARHRSDYYLCAFQLVDLRDAQLVWEDAYEVKYAITRNALD
jgi:hypothetical protein